MNEFTAKDLENAYLEGFHDGWDHGNLSWKYPPLSNAYLISDTRLLASDSLPPEDLLKVAGDWKNCQISEQQDYVLDWEQVRISD